MDTCIIVGCIWSVLLIWLPKGFTTFPHFINLTSLWTLDMKRSCASDTPIIYNILELSVFAYPFSYHSQKSQRLIPTGSLYYSFCLLHCILDKVPALKHNLYISVIVYEHLINYIGKHIPVVLLQHTILG